MLGLEKHTHTLAKLEEHSGFYFHSLFSDYIVFSIVFDFMRLTCEVSNPPYYSLILFAGEGR